MHNTISIPMNYLDSLEDKQHLMLFYEDAEYARLIEFLFIKRGLENGESCIYATADDTGATILMLQYYGIQLEDFRTKRVQVFHISPISGEPEQMLLDCKKEISKILSGIKKPFRIVARIVSDVSTIKGMSVEAELEKCTHDCFEDFGGSIMCPYDMANIEKSRRSEWIKKLYSNHHAVIYIPKYGEGGVICSVNQGSSGKGEFC